MRGRAWRSRACSDAKTSAEAKKVDIEGYISPRVRVVRIGSGRSVDRLKVEPLWKEMSKNLCCWPPGDRARERRSSGGGHGCSWCRELAHTARGCLPAPRVSVQGVLGRRGLALCWSAHASSLDMPPRHSSQRWLGLDWAWTMRSSPALRGALLGCFVLALALDCAAKSRTMHRLSAAAG